MKRSTKIIIIILVVFLILCHIDFRPWFYKKQSDYLNRVDETRKEYNIGSCYNMQEELCYYIIFLDDDENLWNEEEKEIFINKKFLPTINYLSDQAAAYNTEITKNYTVCEKQISYKGIIESETVQNGAQYDILTQVSISMGYESPSDMTKNLKKELSVKQVAYLIAVNKEGRSYKLSHHHASYERKQEFCVFFAKTIGYTDTTCASSIAHEILHLFGAEDYYDPYGNYPERKKLATTLYPNDIMFSTSVDINEKTVGAYTAYSVGWFHELPEECNVEEWWK